MAKREVISAGISLAVEALPFGKWAKMLLRAGIKSNDLPPALQNKLKGTFHKNINIIRNEEETKESQKIFNDWIKNNIRKIMEKEFIGLDQRNLENPTKQNIVTTVRKVIDKLDGGEEVLVHEFYVLEGKNFVAVAEDDLRENLETVAAYINANPAKIYLLPAQDNSALTTRE